MGLREDISLEQSIDGREVRPAASRALVRTGFSSSPERHSRLSRDSVRRFTKRADFYSRYRPGYPGKIISLLERETGFNQEAILADIGSGTGLLTKLFLKNGNKVFAVEPNDRMRSHAEDDLSSFKNFISVKGTAERTNLQKNSVDLITVGQALHWFDREKAVNEFSRILKPGGRLCVVYNEWKRAGRFMHGYETVIKRNRRNRASVPNLRPKYMARFFKDGKCARFSLPNEQVVGYSGLLGRFLSASYMPTPGEGERYVRLEKDARELFDSYSSGGRVKLRYHTNIFIGEVANRPRRRRPVHFS